MAERRKQHWTERFLKRLRHHGNISWAVKGAGGRTTRSKVYWRRDHDPEFAQLMDEAREEGNQNHDAMLEYEISDRAFDRTDKASHILLMFRAKRRMPEYREGYVPPPPARKSYHLDLESIGKPDLSNKPKPETSPDHG